MEEMPKRRFSKASLIGFSTSVVFFSLVITLYFSLSESLHRARCIMECADIHGFVVSSWRNKGWCWYKSQELELCMDRGSHPLGDQRVALGAEGLSGEPGVLSVGPHLWGWVHTWACLSKGMASVSPTSMCFRVDGMTLASREQQASNSSREFLSKLMLHSF